MTATFEEKKELMDAILALDAMATSLHERLEKRETTPSAVWQPIETAPADKVILVWGKYYITPFFAAYGTLGKDWLTSQDFTLPSKPTHWIPMPKMPKEE